MREYVLNTYMKNASRPWNSMNGHYPFHHYAGEWGFDVLGSEIGENINSYQMMIAFNRGAARQYRTPWFIDFSPWHGPGITDYSDQRVWGDYSGSDHGHSLNLFKRSYFVSYMSGAGAVVAEAGGVNFFTGRRDGEGYLLLSPLGEVGRAFNAFVREYPDRGVAYTPFGIVVDYYHGTYSATTDAKKAFDFFPYEKGDYTTWHLLDLFFPGGWTAGGRNEKDLLTETPYGDTCDVLLQNASPNVLASYPVLVLSGQILLSSGERKNYVEYVENGGILLLNELTLHQFPRSVTGVLGVGGAGTVRGYGKGFVAHYGDPTREKKKTGEIIAALAETLLPFRVEGNVQYLISRRARGWVVTIVNNEGITKDFRSPPAMDPKKAQSVTISFSGIGTVTDLRPLYVDSTSVVSFDASSGRVEGILAPGDIAIIEFIVDWST
jgi:hypothetical protein